MAIHYEIMITPIEIEEKSDLGNVIKRKKIGIEGLPRWCWKKENPFSAVPKSIEVTYTMIKTMLRGIYHMIAGDISTKEIGGPIAIVQLTGKQAKGGIWSLVTFVAFISINLGILNLLPIPVLDGGHILFNFIEIITRRKISEKIVDIAQKIGLTLLIMLMAFAFYNDIMRLFQTKAFLDYMPGSSNSSPPNRLHNPEGPLMLIVAIDNSLDLLTIAVADGEKILSENECQRYSTYPFGNHRNCHGLRYTCRYRTGDRRCKGPLCHPWTGFIYRYTGFAGIL